MHETELLSSVWLRPDDSTGKTSAELTTVYRTLEGAVPFCNDASARGAFVPHLRYGK